MPTYVLDNLPWGFRYPGVEYWKSKKVSVYKGATLPEALRPYQTQDFSYARWREDELNGIVSPTSKSNTIFTPHDHQKDGAKAIFQAYANNHSGMLISDGTGTGKGLASSTKIPTPNGFITMGEIKEGDVVYGAKGTPTKVIEKYKSQAKKFYKITFSDGTVVEADEDHRWLTSTRKERKRVFNNTKTRRRLSQEAQDSLEKHLLYSQDMKEAVTFYSCLQSANNENPAFIREILSLAGSIGGKKTKLYHPQSVLESFEKINFNIGNRWSQSGVMPTSSVKNTAEIFETQYSGTKKTHKNHSVQNTSPIIGEYKDLLVDPYILGTWLGDGGSYHCEITSMDNAIIERISTIYPVQRTFGEEKSGKAKSYSFAGMYSDIHKLYSALSKTKIAKYIPEEYMHSGFSQRLELLKGLLDTDGSISHRESEGVTFSQKDKFLFFQVYSLICSMGWKVTWRSKEVAYDADAEKHTYYELLFYPDKQVFSLPRKAKILEKSLKSFSENRKNNRRYIVKVEEIEKTEDYYCISVDSPDHLYLCTESYLPTHNTLTSLAGVTAIARAEKKRGKFKNNERATLLIVCPKSVIPGWRQTLQSFPIATEFLRPLIINYHQLNKLLNPPPASRLGKKTKTKNRNTARYGEPTINWDYVIMDESHKAKSYPSSAMSLSAANIAQLNKPYKRGQSPFVLYSTATPGASPLNFAVMSQVIAPLLNKVSNRESNEIITPDKWGEFLDSHNFAVKKGKVEWTWGAVPWFGKNSDDPKERRKYEESVAQAKKRQRADSIKIGKALKTPGAPFIMRKPQDIAGWPEQNLIPLPAELTREQVPIYEEAWNRFRQFLNLSPKGADPKGALVEQLRYRQKSSLLKVDSVAEHVAEFVENGNQVYISCQFSETIDKFKEVLAKQKIKVGEFSGRNASDRENDRIAFQKGEYQVILSSVVEGVSFHAEETLPDGSKATKNERITIIHDIRQNNLDTMQALGRCHRDGKHSIAYFPYFLETVDGRVVESFTNKTANMKAMTGASQEESEELEDMFREAAALASH